MEINDRVRIVRDEYPELVGREGLIKQFSYDQVTAWIESDSMVGVWCCVSDLELVK